MNSDAHSVSDSAIWREDRHSLLLDRLQINLFLADAVTLPQGKWRSQNVRDPFWRFYHNQDSGAFVTLNDTPEPVRFRFQPGRSYFVPEGVCFSCGSDAAFRHFYVHFEATGMPRLLLSHAFSRPVALNDGADWTGRVERLAAVVRQTRSLDLVGQCLAKSLLFEGMAQVIARALDNSDLAARLAQEKQAQEAVAPALDYLTAHLSASLSIAELAAQCCLSPDYFARRFRECLGMTPGAYLRQQRVERAARRLLFSADSIDAIAAQCGFGSRFYLTRVFSQVIGVSPAAYRKAGPRA